MDHNDDELGRRPPLRPGVPAGVELALAGLDSLTEWFSSPSPRRGRVVVPEFVGRYVTECWGPALDSGVHLRFVRLTENPAPTDGVVVAQDPEPGAKIKRGGNVTLTVLHPAANGTHPRPEPLHD